jgi:hypothetical protein
LAEFNQPFVLSSEGAISKHDDVGFQTLFFRPQQTAAHAESLVIGVGRKYQPRAGG